ncbi:DnaJ domain-containing protein [Zoogloea sp.]|uniref:J domain-containing protein n=1 Tax=Zoogloea sp. TaxID=49181 RepID=UPI00262949B2|nr:DnaJ domain-containing protein [Zoogloea sp.]
MGIIQIFSAWSRAFGDSVGQQRRARTQAEETPQPPAVDPAASDAPQAEVAAPDVIAAAPGVTPPVESPEPVLPETPHPEAAKPSKAARPAAGKGRSKAASVQPEPAPLQVRDDPETEALRQKIAAIEVRRRDLLARKAQLDEAMLAFHIAQYEALGSTLETCLGLRLEYLLLKAARSGTEADARAAREAAAEHEACRMHPAEEGDALQALDEATRAELKQHYRSAAMRCHPDRVADADKAGAGAIFLRVQQAYRSADLPALLALCRELDHGPGGARGSAQADSGDALRRQLDALVDEVTELILEGQNARLDPQYRQAFHRESWAGEFAEMRARLEAECDDLRWQIRVISRG